MVAIYVDDCLICGRKENVDELKGKLQESLNISDLGELKKHLGVNYTNRTDKVGSYLQVDMKSFVENIAEDYGKVRNLGGKTAKTPGFPGKIPLKNSGEIIDQDIYRSFVGRLLFVIKKCIPEATNAIRQLAGYMDSPSEEHWRHLTRLVSYLQGNYKPMKLRAPTSLRVETWVDSDYATDQNDRKSITGYITTIGGTIISWSSKKQGGITTSSSEAEYVALLSAAKESKFIRMILEEVTGDKLAPALIHEDNKGTVFMTNNQTVGQRTKHIDIAYRYTNQLVEQKIIELEHVKSEENVADILTKNVTETLHAKHTRRIHEGTNDPSTREGVEMCDVGMTKS